MRSLALLVLCGLLAAGCSKTGGGDAPADVPDRLAELAGQPGTVLVVRDTADTYWALPSSGIRHAGGRTLAIQPGTTVAGGSGDGPAETIAGMVLEQWPDGGPYFMTMNHETGDTLMVNGQVGDATEEILLEVEEIVITRAE
jgi:hypothetical protein